MPTPAASSVLVDTVAVTVVDGLRVRSKPRVGDDSFKYEPLLPLGTQLYVLDGPVSASDYTWYEVVPLASRTLPRGWVAIAGRDGEPWLEAGDFDCPPLPSDFRSLAALPDGVGLACFSRVPITVKARLIWCACDIDGSWYTPPWFHLNDDPDLLVEPGVTSVPPDKADWFGLNLDPAGEHPDVLPEGEVVEVHRDLRSPSRRELHCDRDGRRAGPHPGLQARVRVTKLVRRP